MQAPVAGERAGSSSRLYAALRALGERVAGLEMREMRDQKQSLRTISAQMLAAGFRLSHVGVTKALAADRSAT
jgi:hypothetical protein